MLASIQDALRDYAAGRMVIIVDDEDRENEGDLACAAQFVTPETIAFMACQGRGPICLAMTGGQLDRHQLYRLDRGGPWRHHRHLGRRPRPDHPRRDRPHQRTSRPGAAGAYLSAAGGGGRGAGAPWPD